MFTHSDKGPDWSWYKRASEAIAQGALTNSKRVECLVKGVYPTHMARGNGCHLYDTSGKSYVDFICGLGTNLIGYGHPQIAEAIRERALLGVSLSMGSAEEVLLAEELKATFPCMDRVKLLKTGTEACAAAIKIARAYSGKYRVLSQGYHGWSDPFISIAPPALGLPRTDHYVVPFSDNYAESELVGAAAVILEPVMTDASPARGAWLHRLRELCTKHEVVLIFDEIITGCRFPGYSAANYFGVTPDLICLGKALGNGMPIAVVGGKRDIMNCGEYFVSGTYYGDTCSIAAARTVLSLLKNKFRIEELWEAGGRFQSKFNSIWPEGVRLDGYPTRGVFAGNVMEKALFWQEACRAGLLFGPSWFINFQHRSVIDSVLATCEDILLRVKTGSVSLIGELPASPFAQRMRERNA